MAAAELCVLRSVAQVGTVILRYVELKTGHSDNGPAWIARVTTSKSGRTIYFNGRALLSAGGRASSGNYIDVESRDTYWVSGVKKNARDRHWAGGGIVWIETSAVAEYLATTGVSSLPRHIQIVPDLPAGDPARSFGISESEGVQHHVDEPGVPAEGRSSQNKSLHLPARGVARAERVVVRGRR